MRLGTGRHTKYARALFTSCCLFDFVDETAVRAVPVVRVCMRGRVGLHECAACVWMCAFRVGLCARIACRFQMGAPCSHSPLLPQLTVWHALCVYAHT